MNILLNLQALILFLFAATLGSILGVIQLVMMLTVYLVVMVCHLLSSYQGLAFVFLMAVTYSLYLVHLA